MDHKIHGKTALEQGRTLGKKPLLVRTERCSRSSRICLGQREQSGPEARGRPVPVLPNGRDAWLAVKHGPDACRPRENDSVPVLDDRGQAHCSSSGDLFAHQASELRALIGNGRL